MKRCKEAVLYEIWAAMYVAAVLLSLVNHAQGVGLVLIQIYSVAFFIPGAILLIDALRSKDSKTLLLLRWVSGLSLGLTLVLTVLNLVSVLGPQWLGDLVYVLLGLASVPMLCGRFWWLSLFLWGSFLTASLLYAPQKGK